MTLAKFAEIGIDTNDLFRTADLADAKRFARQSMKTVRLVFMGCDGRYWVVSARQSGKLRKAGYETI